MSAAQPVLDWHRRLPPADPALGGRKFTNRDYEHWWCYLTAKSAVAALEAENAALKGGGEAKGALDSHRPAS